MANKASGASKTSYYARYKSSEKWKSNRLARLLKQLELQPNNAVQINKAIENLSYRRQTPKTRMWSSSNKRAAQILKEFSGSATHDIFSSNPKTASAALQKTWRKFEGKVLKSMPVDFSLGARLQG